MAQGVWAISNQLDSGPCGTKPEHDDAELFAAEAEGDFHLRGTAPRQDGAWDR